MSDRIYDYLSDIESKLDHNDEWKRRIIDGVQNAELTDLLEYARKNTDFYADIKESDISLFPVINKQIIKDNKDKFFVLKDFDAYVKAHEKANELYKNRKKWLQMSLVNISKSGNFSTDRTMEDYNRDIWKLTKIGEIK